MTQLLSSQGIDISQKNFQQIIIRGDGKDQFNKKIIVYKLIKSVNLSLK